MIDGAEMQTLARELVREVGVAYPHEGCGVIFRDGSWKKIRNVHPVPTSNFAFDEAELIEIFGSRFHEVEGVWHTHPSGNPHPSPHDCEFPYPTLRYFTVTQADMYEWGLSDGRCHPINPATGEAGASQLAYPILGDPAKL